MKKLHIILVTCTMIAFILLSLSSCSDDHYFRYSYDDPTIYSSSKNIQFSEMILFLSPYTNQDGEKRYIFANNLENLSINLNGKNWQVDKSYELDTLHLANKETINGYRTTSDKINFPFIINVRYTPESYNTAGEYSDLLNNYFTLSPGVYICRVTSFDIQNAQKEVNKIYTPTISLPLEIKDNQSSTNLGTFEVFIQ